MSFSCMAAGSYFGVMLSATAHRGHHLQGKAEQILSLPQGSQYVQYSLCMACKDPQAVLQQFPRLNSHEA